MPKYGLLLTLAVLAALTARLLTPPFIHLFHQGRQLKRNFRRELIPQGTGILFVLCSLPWYALYLATAKLSLPDISTVFLLALAVLTMGLLGLLDDPVSYTHLTSEDIALLLAYEQGADLIVAVGCHSNMIDFLEKGRQGMASTFLVRLKVGSILVDAKGVSKLYQPALSPHYVLGLLMAALVRCV